MSTFGKRIPISLFGESHGDAVGITIHHLDAGLKLDVSAIEKRLSFRRPQGSFDTKRHEIDAFKIISGIFEGRTTGAPLTVIIENKDIDSTPYLRDIPRPGHVDYPAYIKYQGHHDYRGGGHFSGRLTAPLIILGEIARQFLSTNMIDVYSHVKSIDNVNGPSFYDSNLSDTLLRSLQNEAFPVLDVNLLSRYTSLMKEAYLANDSLGGTIETMITGLPIGVGEPFFDSLESTLSHLIFSIPAVKGLSFGKGFALTKMKASESNDPLTIENQEIVFTKNDMGGILGGLSTGQPLIFTTAIKAPSTIKSSQKTVNLSTKEAIVHAFTGRHDTVIVSRALHVINALSYYAILELLNRKDG